MCRADGADVRNNIGPRGDVEPDLLAHFEIEWLDGCACGGCQGHQVPPRRPQLQPMFSGANLTGADFSTWKMFNLDGMERVCYSDETKFPDNFEAPPPDCEAWQ